MTDILLTSEQFVKSVTSISDNIAGKYLLPSMREAQEVEYRGIVGDALLAKLKSDVAAGTLSGAYLQAVERSQYFLAYTSVVKLTGKVSYKVTNFGVAKSDDENLKVVDQSELVHARGVWQNAADSAALDLQNWLLENKASLPELSQKKCTQIAANLYSHATCGVFLGGARGKIIRNPKNGRS